MLRAIVLVCFTITITTHAVPLPDKEPGLPGQDVVSGATSASKGSGTEGEAAAAPSATNETLSTLIDGTAPKSDDSDKKDSTEGVPTGLPKGDSAAEKLPASIPSTGNLPAANSTTEGSDKKTENEKKSDSETPKDSSKVTSNTPTDHKSTPDDAKDKVKNGSEDGKLPSELETKVLEADSKSNSGQAKPGAENPDDIAKAAGDGKKDGAGTGGAQDKKNDVLQPANGTEKDKDINKDLDAKAPINNSNTLNDKTAAGYNVPDDKKDKKVKDEGESQSTNSTDIKKTNSSATLSTDQNDKANKPGSEVKPVSDNAKPTQNKPDDKNPSESEPKSESKNTEKKTTDEKEGENKTSQDAKTGDKSGAHGTDTKSGDCSSDSKKAITEAQKVDTTAKKETEEVTAKKEIQESETQSEITKTVTI